MSPKECHLCEPILKCEAKCEKIHKQELIGEAFDIYVFGKIDDCKRRKEILKTMPIEEYVVFIKEFNTKK